MRLVNYLLIALGTSVVSADNPSIPLVPARDKAVVQKADVWINGGKPEKTNLTSAENQDSFSGKPLRLMYPESTLKELFAVYRFEIKNTGTYQFYGALTHQGMSYTSPVKYRFDGSEWKNFTLITGPRTSWGESSAVNWENLGEIRLTAGSHTLELFFDRKADSGMWSFICDGIMAFNNDSLDKIKIENLSVTGIPAPNGKVNLTFRAVGGNALVEAIIKLANDRVTSQTIMIRPGENHMTLQLPQFAGSAEYDIVVRAATRPEKILATQKIVIGTPPENVIKTAIIENAAITDNSYSLNVKSPVEATILALLFIGEELQAVDHITIKPGQTEISGNFTPEFCNVATGKDGAVKFVACPGSGGNIKTAEIHIAGKPVPLSKPINYGFFSDRYGHEHPWYMDRQNRYIFDGKPYIPFGGMWCPSSLTYQCYDEKEFAKQFEHDRKTMKTLLDAGIDDVYLNMATGAQNHLKQYMVDTMEKYGINYSYQLNGGGGQNIPAFFITRDRDKIPNWQGLLRGSYQNGDITVKMPKSYKVAGLLLLPDNGHASWCRLISFQDHEGKNTRHHIIDLEKVQDFNDQRTVTFKTTLPAGAGNKLIVIPLLDATMAHDNLWNPQRLAQVKQNLSWIGKVQWGPHLRCFIDPVCNETNMVNTSENLRQYTSYINAEFATWLKRKYGTESAMAKSWQVKQIDFNIAARLIPLRLGNILYLADPESGKVYKSTLKTSQAWIDYNEMIRETYATYYDDIARYIKSLVNIPVINKSVGAFGSPLHVSRGYLGWDGTGFEIYGGEGLPISGGGASFAEAQASSHTMWMVGTEVGHDFNVGNGGVKFFKDEKEIRNTTDNLTKLGVSGFYYFGFDLKPGNMWDNHNCHDFPEGLRWISKIKQDYLAGRHPARIDQSFFFPGGYGWWWWVTRFSAIYDYEQNQVPLTTRIKDYQWACSTNVLPADFKRVIVSCPNPPFSIRYAGNISEAIKRGLPVIYLGERRDLGSIKGLDEFFTDDIIKFSDGSTAQALRRLPKTQILAEEKGRIWALRSGNLIIVSRCPIKNHEGDQNFDTGFKYLNPEWL